MDLPYNISATAFGGWHGTEASTGVTWYISRPGGPGCELIARREGDPIHTIRRRSFADLSAFLRAN